MTRDTYGSVRLFRALSSLTLSVSRDGASTISPSNLFLCLTTLIVNIFFSLMPSLNLPSFCLKQCRLVLSNRAYYRDCPLLSYSPPINTERLLSDLPRTFFSPGWTAPALSACPSRKGVPSLASFLWSPSRCASTCPHLSCTEDSTSVLHVWSHLCIAKRQGHLPCLGGHSSFDAARIWLAFGAAGTLLAHVQLASHQYPQVLLVGLLLVLSSPVHTDSRVVPTQVQYLPLGFIESHEVHLGPLLALVWVSLDGILSLKCVDHTSQLGAICGGCIRSHLLMSLMKTLNVLLSVLTSEWHHSSLIFIQTLSNWPPFSENNLATSSSSIEQFTHQIHIFPIWREECYGAPCQSLSWSPERLYQLLFLGPLMR